MNVKDGNGGALIPIGGEEALFANIWRRLGGALMKAVDAQRDGKRAARAEAGRAADAGRAEAASGRAARA